MLQRLQSNAISRNSVHAEQHQKADNRNAQSKKRTLKFMWFAFNEFSSALWLSDNVACLWISGSTLVIGCEFHVIFGRLANRLRYNEAFCQGIRWIYLYHIELWSRDPFTILNCFQSNECNRDLSLNPLDEICNNTTTSCGMNYKIIVKFRLHRKCDWPSK